MTQFLINKGYKSNGKQQRWAARALADGQGKCKGKGKDEGQAEFDCGKGKDNGQAELDKGKGKEKGQDEFDYSNSRPRVRDIDEFGLFTDDTDSE